ncbi:MAG: prepilin-type N-terminal cleavage/methylation domain-containing protein [Acetatifactor sp.]|nr:prepilin-type N-terminal cleavage/methylation domain-containing protein [Acetatifactor sp.]
MVGDNRGFSLVELLAAIAILAIVVSPFLHSFITAANTNSRARRVMQATAAAEDIFERLRPLQLGDGIVSLMNRGNCRELLINENATPVGGTDRYCTVNDGTGLKFVKNDSGVYYFAILDEEVDSSKYDIFATIDTRDYADNYNSEALTKITDIDLKKDVLYTLTSDMENRVFAEFADRSSRYFAGRSGTAAKAADFANSLKRSMTFTIEPVGILTRVSLKIEYTDEFSRVAPSEKTYSKTMELYLSDGTNELRNIYFLYTPNYDSRSGSVKDIFNVLNYSKIDCNVFFVKQVSGTDLASRETTYVANVNLSEANSTSERYNSAITGIYSNFGQNLGKKEAGLSDYAQTDKTVYTYNGLTGVSATNLMKYGDIVKNEPESRIYSVDLKIYQKDAYNDEDNTFDEDKFIIEIDN